MPAPRWTQKPPVGTPVDRARSAAAGLVGCWPLNEGTGAPVEVVSGTVAASNTLAWRASDGHAAVLAGAGAQYFTTPTAAGCPLDVTGAGLSYGAWFNSHTTGGYKTILTKQHPTTTGARQYGLFTVNGTQSQVYVQVNGVANFGNGGAATLVNLSAPWVLDEWNMAVVTYDGAYVRVYLNGQLGAAVAATGPVATVAGSQVYCGYDTAYASNGLDGSVDIPMVWARALAAAEVASLYRDPWQVFRPRHAAAWSYAAPAAGGGAAPAGQPAVTGVGYQFDGPIVATGLSITAIVSATGASVPGTTSYNSSTHLATFTPNPANPFVAGVKYLITVSGATALDGTPMIPDSFPFSPGGAAGRHWSPRGGRRTGRLTA